MERGFYPTLQGAMADALPVLVEDLGDYLAFLRRETDPAAHPEWREANARR